MAGPSLIFSGKPCPPGMVHGGAEAAQGLTHDAHQVLMSRNDSRPDATWLYSSAPHTQPQYYQTQCYGQGENDFRNQVYTPFYEPWLDSSFQENKRSWNNWEIPLGSFEKKG